MSRGSGRTKRSDRGADRWRRFVAGIRSGADCPFEKHWALFRDIEAGRRPGDGPPIVWRPDAASVARSNLSRLMAGRRLRSYRALHAWSVARRDEFWGDVIDRLGIVFARRPDAILDRTTGVEDPRWLPGARLSIVDSCFKADPRRPAVIAGAEGRAGLTVTTYGDLQVIVNRFANGLRDRGVARGDGIALYMPMTLECVAAYLGAVRAGCRVVSIADSFSAAEVARRCRLGDARAIVTVESYLRSGRVIDLYSRVREAGGPRSVVIPAAGPGSGGSADLRRGDMWWDDLLSGRTELESGPSDPHDVTNVLFSSGTTGEPKVIPWSQLTPIKCAMDGHFHQDIHPGDVVAWPTNIGWMMGPWLIYASLINEAAMALYEGTPAGDGFTRFVEEAGVTMLGVVPSLVRAWRSTGAAIPGGWKRIRVFSSTGEPSSREDYLWLMSLAGYRAPVVEYLGGTEIGGAHITGTVVQPASPATFTTPALGIDFTILDEQGVPVGENGTGELYLIPPSIGLSRMLLNADHHEAYHAGCPRGPKGEILRRHGDLFLRLPRGFYRAQGRADDTMNLGGIKVSSRELERVVDGHPSVYESAAVAVRPGGEGADRLVLFVVPRGEVDRPRLTGALQGRIGAELNPLFRVHDVVLVDALPRTASNKLMRRTLRARYANDGGT